MLWTIVPADELMGEEEGPESVAEMSVGGVTVVVRTDEYGRRRVERLLSTNPADYLRSEWQPGSPWRDGGKADWD